MPTQSDTVYSNSMVQGLPRNVENYWVGQEVPCFKALNVSLTEFIKARHLILS
jgi:hypothetical protein